jgi:tetratricopeptide (TPR) repeat protein
VAIGLDDALLGWLVASAGDALARRLRSNPVRRAMRQVVANAVSATAGETAGRLDSRQVEHLRHVMQEHDAGIPGAEVSSLKELRAAVRAWIAADDQPVFGEPGYLTRLGIDADQLAEQLARRVESGVHDNGRAGGALAPLAQWLWRDDLKADVGALQRDLSELRRAVEPPPQHGGGLPGGTPDFTGRRQVLDELAEHVEAHDSAGTVLAIYALDGMAGVGKTELAVRAAHQHKHRYPDGQYFINLHGYTTGLPTMTPEEALEELLCQAGVPAKAIPPRLAGRQARWQALMATKRAMVVLDNALDAAQVLPLLPNSPGCLVLITSRSRLVGLPGARTVPLEVLPPGEAIELFTRLAGADRCGDRDAVAQVVDLVGRLPVAVQAVAVQMRRDDTVADLAEDLTAAKRTSGLVAEGSSPDIGVRAAFETSLRRLDRTHRRAFRILGVYPGPSIGVPQFAALAGLPPGRAGTILRRLADRNLINPAGTRIGHRRYELHDLVREFARQQADSCIPAEERPAAIARLSGWYLSAMKVVDPWRAVSSRMADLDLEGLSLNEAEHASAWLAAEQSNLLAYADNATGADAAEVCYTAGLRYLQFDHYAVAGALLRSAAGTFHQVADRIGEAHARLELGYVAKSTGDHTGADEHYHAALAISREMADRRMETEVLDRLGGVAVETGDHQTAGAHHRLALEISRQINHKQGEAEALSGLGTVAFAARDYATAEEYFRDAIALHRQLGNKDREAFALEMLGRLALATGDHARAEMHLSAALTLSRQIEQPMAEGHALQALASLATATSDDPTAKTRLHAAVEVYRRVGSRISEAFALWELGELARNQGRPEEARAHWRSVLVIYTEVGWRDVPAARQALEGLGQG